MAGVPRSGRSVQRRVCRVLSAITVMSHNYMGARARASPRLQQSTLFVKDVFGLKPASIVIVEAWKRNSRKSQAPKSKKACAARRSLALPYVLAKALRFPLSANRASKEVGIDFANTVELWFYFRVLEAGASEGMPPMIRGQKTGIRSKLRIDIDVGKTIQDLKYQFRIHRLVEIGAHALA